MYMSAVISVVNEGHTSTLCSIEDQKSLYSTKECRITHKTNSYTGVPVTAILEYVTALYSNLFAIKRAPTPVASLSSEVN